MCECVCGCVGTSAPMRVPCGPGMPGPRKDDELPTMVMA